VSAAARVLSSAVPPSRVLACYRLACAHRPPDVRRAADLSPLPPPRWRERERAADDKSEYRRTMIVLKFLFLRVLKGIQ